MTTPDVMERPAPIAGDLIEGLTANNVKIGKTEFRINALLPEEGFDVLEEIRESAISPSNLYRVLENPTQEGIRNTLIAVLASLPKPIVKSIRNQMFTAVTFTNETAVTPQVLAGRLGMAFDPMQGLNSFHIYEMTVRCLAVNFLESSLDFLSHLSVQAPISQD